MTSFQTEKCCHLVSGHAVSAGRLCSTVRQFLIYSTSIIVITRKPLGYTWLVENIPH